MPTIFYDSTGDTSSSTGTGSLIGLGVAPDRYRIPSSAGVTTGISTMIRIENSSGSQWEVCESVITVSGPTYIYSRGELQASSTGARVNFSSGVKNIYFVIGQKYLYADRNIIADTAGGTLSGHKVVLSIGGVIQYADRTNVAHAPLVIGVTTGSSTVGNPVYIQTSGEMEDPSFTFTQGQPIYLSTSGGLTQTPPTSGFIMQVATALTTTRIAISIKAPIIF